MASKGFSTWAKNFGKSTKYATVNLVESIAPSTVRNIADTRVAVQDFRGTMRSTRSSASSFITDLSKNKLAKKADKEYKTALRAIKSGRFAVKNSNRKNNSSFAIPGFDDIDKALNFDNFDFGDGFNFSPNIEVNMNNEATLEAMRVTGEMQANVAMQSANFISDSINNTSIAGFIKINQQLMTTNSYLENIDNNLKSIIEFNNENTAITNAALMDFMSEFKDYMQEAKDQKEKIRKTKEAKDFYAEREKRGFDLFTGSSGLGDYLSYVGKNVKSGINDVKELSAMVPMFFGGSGKSLIETGFTNLLKNAFFTTETAENLSRLDKVIPNIIRNALIDYGKNGLFGNIFGIGSSKIPDKIKFGDYYKDELSWDGEAKKALTQVIPSQLNQILKAIDSNADVKTFDYASGKYYSQSDIEKLFSKRVNGIIDDSASDVLYSFESIINNAVSGLSDNDTEREKLSENFNLMLKSIYGNNLKAGKVKGVNKLDVKNLGMLTDFLTAEGFDSKDIDVFTSNIMSNAKTKQISSFLNSIREAEQLLEEFGSNIGRGIDNSWESNTILQQMFMNGESFQDAIFNSMDANKRKPIKTKHNKKKDDKLQELLDSGYTEEEARQKLANADNAKNATKGLFSTIKNKFTAPFANSPIRKFTSKISDAGNEVEDKLLNFVYGDRSTLLEDIIEGVVIAYTDRVNSASSIINGNGLEGNIENVIGNSFSYKDAIKYMNKGKKSKDLNENNIGKEIDDITDDLERGHEPETAEEAEIQLHVAQTKTFTGLVHGLYSTFLRPTYDKVFGKDGIISKIYNNETFTKVRKEVTKFLVGEKGEDRIYRDGVFSGFANIFADGMDYMKYIFTGKGYTSREGKVYQNNQDESVIGKLGAGFTNIYTNMMKYLFGGKDGNYEENPFYQQTFAKLESGFDALKQKFNKIEYGEDVIEIPNGVNNDTDTVVEEVATTANKQLSGKISNIGERMESILLGDPNVSDSQKEKNIFKSMKSKLPAIALGATVGAAIPIAAGGSMGLILGSFLPGNPIGGAMLGIGAGLLSKSEKVQRIMFGDVDENGQRQGGLISNSLKDKFKGMLPVILGGGTLGAIKTLVFGGGAASAVNGLLPMALLPGGVLGGALLSVAGAMVYRSEKFQELMFGSKNEDGSRAGTKFSTALSGISDKLKSSANFIVGGLKGAALGGVSASIIGNMGFLGSALTIGGPIGGALAGLGLGIASQTTTFRNLLFGQEKFDEDGNVIGRENNGLISRFINKMEVDVLAPMANKMGDAINDVAYYLRVNFVSPFKRLVGPIIDNFKNVKDLVSQKLDDVFVSIGNGITEVIGKVFEPLTSVVKTVSNKLTSALFNTIKVFGTIVGGFASAPLKAAAGVSQMIFGSKDEKAFRKKYKEDRWTSMSDAWAADKSLGNMMNIFFGEKDEETGKRGKSKYFGYMNENYINSRRAYGEENGLTSLDSWMEPVNLYDIRNKHKEEISQRRKRDELLKIRSEFQKRDKNSEKELTAKEYALRYKRLKDAGFDMSEINSYSDINDWTYRNKEFNDAVQATQIADSITESNLQIGSVTHDKLDHIIHLIEPLSRNVDAIIDSDTLEGHVENVIGTDFDDKEGREKFKNLLIEAQTESSKQMYHYEQEVQKDKAVREAGKYIHEEDEDDGSGTKAEVLTAEGKTTKKRTIFDWLGTIVGSIGGIKSLLPEIITAGTVAAFMNPDTTKQVLGWVGEGFKTIGGNILATIKDAVVNGVKDKRTDVNGEVIEYDDITGTSVATAAMKGIVKGNIGEQFVKSGKLIKTTGKVVGAVASNVPIVRIPTKIAMGVGTAIGEHFKPNPDVIKNASTGIVSKFVQKASAVMLDIVNNPKLAKLVNDNKVLKSIAEFVNETIEKLMKNSAIHGKFADIIRQKGGKLVAGAIEAIPGIGTAILVGTSIWDLATGAMDAANLFGVHEDEVDSYMRVTSSIIKFLIGLSLPGAVLDVIATTILTIFNIDWKQTLATKIYEILAGAEKATELKTNQDDFEAEWEDYNKYHATKLSRDAYKDLASPTTWKKLTTSKDERDTEKYIAVYSGVAALDAFYKDTTEPSKVHGTGTPLGFGSTPMSQNDPRWRNTVIGTNADGSIATMSSGGCGPTALAAAYSLTTGKGLSPEVVGKMAANSGYISKGGANANLFTQGASDLGLVSKKIASNDIEAQLMAGNPVIVSGKSGKGNSLYSKIGHILTVKGVDDNGNATVIDPLDGKMKRVSMDNLKSGMTNAWVFGKNGFRKSVGAPYAERDIDWKTNTRSNWVSFTKDKIVENAEAANTNKTNMFDSQKVQLSNGASWDAYNGVVYYKQNDSAWKDTPYGSSTIGKIGCIMTSLAMALSGMSGKAITPETVVSRWGNSHWNSSVGGTNWSIISDSASGFGIKTENLNISGVKTALEAGKPVLLYGHKSPDGNVYGKGSESGTHSVLATGVRDNGNIRINDPGSETRTKNLLSTGISFDQIRNGFTRAYSFADASGKGLTPKSSYSIIDNTTDLTLGEKVGNTLNGAGDYLSSLLAEMKEKMAPLAGIANNALRSFLFGEKYQSVYDENGNYIGASTGGSSGGSGGDLDQYKNSADVTGIWSGFGKLSGKYESGNNMASMGPDTGGWAFGKNQWNSGSSGGLNSFFKFMKSKYPDFYNKYFAHVYLGTPSNPSQTFKDAWTLAATGEDAKLFERINDEAVYDLYYKGIRDHVQNKYGISINDMNSPYAIKEALLSTAIQHGVGGAKSIVDKIASIDDESEFLTALYNGRISKFSVGKPRYDKELQDALALINTTGYGSDKSFNNIEELFKLTSDEAIGYGKDRIITGSIKQTDDIMEGLIRGGRNNYDKFEFESLGFGPNPKEDIIKRIPFNDLISATKGSSNGVEQRLDKLIKVIADKEMSNTINIDKRSNINMVGKGSDVKVTQQKPVVINKQTQSTPKENALRKKFDLIAKRA